MVANLELTSDIVGSRTMPCCDPTGLAVGFFAFPSKSRALAEDFSASIASALQAPPVHKDSVQNLLIYCTHCFFLVACFLNRCEYINFPGFPALYSSSTQKWELEMQQNALWSTGPSLCLGGTHLTPSCKVQVWNNNVPGTLACTGITAWQN